MVRVKSRWILARLDFEPQVLGADGDEVGPDFRGGKRRRISGSREEQKDSSNLEVITRKSIHKAARDCAAAAFGAVGAGLAYNIHVLLYDEVDRMAILKVPRDACGMVRASLTFLTKIDEIPVVVSVISVNGSARTANIAALHELRRNFQLSRVGIGAGTERSLTKEGEKELLKLEARMENVRGID